RFSPKPPAQPIALKAELVDRGGKVVSQVDGKTEASGIFTGHFKLADSLVAGDYVLRVQAAPGAGAVPVTRHTQPLELRREPAAEVEFDKDSYRPGEYANMYFNVVKPYGNVEVLRAIVNGQLVPQSMLQSGPAEFRGGQQLDRQQPFAKNDGKGDNAPFRNG